MSEPHDERYHVRDPEAERALKTLASLVDEHTPEGYGFIVFLFPFQKHGGMFYVSNAERGDAITALKEWIGNAEKRL